MDSLGRQMSYWRDHIRGIILRGNVELTSIIPQTLWGIKIIAVDSNAEV